MLHLATRINHNRASLDNRSKVKDPKIEVKIPSFRRLHLLKIQEKLAKEGKRKLRQARMRRRVTTSKLA